MIFSFLTWGSAVLAATGVPGITLAWTLILLRSFVLYSGPYAVLSRTGLPTFAAALAWRDNQQVSLSNWSTSWWPVAATCLFLLKVPYSLNWLYTAYWLLIPAMVMFIAPRYRSHILLRSLLSSLTAHSVGSLIILYAGLSFPWFALMPLVFVERIVAALGIASVGKLWHLITAPKVQKRRISR